MGDSEFEAKILKNPKVSEDYDEIRLLLNNIDVNPNILLGNGQTALCHAISIDDNRLAELLLSCKKVDLNKKNDLGLMPLFLAALRNNQLIKNLLLEKGANPKLTYNHQTLTDFEVSLTGWSLKLTSYNEILSLPWVTQSHIYFTLFSYAVSLSLEKLQPLLNSQYWLLSKMQAMKTDRRVIFGDYIGYCTAISKMSMLMLLTNQRDSRQVLSGLNKLISLLTRLKYMSVEVFHERMEELERKRLDLLKKVQKEVSGLDNDEIEDGYQETVPATNEADTIEIKKSKLVQHRFEMLIKNQLTENERTDIEISNFLDGIELFQCLNKHGELYHGAFTAPYGALLSLLASDEIEQCGGAQAVEVHTGVFLHQNKQLQNELLTYFQCIRRHFRSLDFPVGFRLDSNYHSIFVCFDPIKDYWIFVDANFVGYEPTEPAVLTLAEDEDITNHVIRAFFSNYLTFNIMATEIYATGDTVNRLKRKLTDLHQDPEFQNLFALSREKMNVKDKNTGKKWVDYAYDYNQSALIHKMYKQRYITRDEYIRKTTLIHWHSFNMNKDLTTFETKANDQDPDLEDFNACYRALIKIIWPLIREIQSPISLHKEEKRLTVEFYLEVLRDVDEEISAGMGISSERFFYPLLSNYVIWKYSGVDVDKLFYHDEFDLFTEVMKLRNIDDSSFLSIQEKYEQDKILAERMVRIINQCTDKQDDVVILEFLKNVLCEVGRLIILNPKYDWGRSILTMAFQNVFEQCTVEIQPKLGLFINDFLRGSPIDIEEYKTKLKELRLQEDLSAVQAQDNSTPS